MSAYENAVQSLINGGYPDRQAREILSFVCGEAQNEGYRRGAAAARDELATQVAAHGPFPMPTGDTGPAPMSAERLIEIRLREEAATPGPWESDGAEIYGTLGGVLMLDLWVGETLDIDNQERSNADAAFIATAREAVPELLAEVADLRARVAELEAAAEKVAAFCAQRAEYVTSLVNCNPDNGHDYDRWQGHAAARRQLSQLLGLPVGWPAEDKQPVPPVSTEDPARCLDVHPFTPRDGWRLTCGSCDHAEGAPCHHRGGTS